jgi:DtxR family Mn-dependent transcriptional regulator
MDLEVSIEKSALFRYTVGRNRWQAKSCEKILDSEIWGCYLVTQMMLATPNILRRQSPRRIVVEKPITSVMEDYLETIFELDRDKKVVRVKDIAHKLGVTMPSVCGMLKSLSDRGLVNYEKYEHVQLTEDGADIGLEIWRRHELIRRFLIDILQIDSETADADACKMEHALSRATLDRLVEFMEFIHLCPRAGENWLNYFAEYRRHGHRPQKCLEKAPAFAEEIQKYMSRGSCRLNQVNSEPD